MARLPAAPAEVTAAQHAVACISENVVDAMGGGGGGEWPGATACACSQGGSGGGARFMHRHAAACQALSPSHSAPHTITATMQKQQVQMTQLQNTAQTLQESPPRWPCRRRSFTPAGRTPPPVLRRRPACAASSAASDRPWSCGRGQGAGRRQLRLSACKLANAGPTLGAHRHPPKVQAAAAAAAVAGPAHQYTTVPHAAHFFTDSDWRPQASQVGTG